MLIPGPDDFHPVECIYQEDLLAAFARKLLEGYNEFVNESGRYNAVLILGKSEWRLWQAGIGFNQVYYDKLHGFTPEQEVLVTEEESTLVWAAKKS